MADETKDAENLTEWAMDEPVTLTVLKNQNPATVNYADGEDQYNNVYYNAYRDNLGITLDFQICASGDEYSQKVTLAIASDDLPDLLYLPVAEYSQLAEAGKLAPLDDVLEQYGSELTKKIQTVEKFWKQQREMMFYMVSLAVMQSVFQVSSFGFAKIGWIS